MFGVIIYPKKQSTQNTSGKYKHVKHIDLETTNTVFLCHKCGEIETMYDGILVNNKWVCETCYTKKE